MQISRSLSCLLNSARKPDNEQFEKEIKEILQSPIDIGKAFSVTKVIDIVPVPFYARDIVSLPNRYQNIIFGRTKRTGARRCHL